MACTSTLLTHTNISKTSFERTKVRAPTKRFTVKPLNAVRWKDLEILFGKRGACGGCWCMWWRLKRSVFEKQKGTQNRAAFKKLVRSGKPTGLILYHGTEPAGWCSVAPREDFPVLDRSRILKPVDETPVWSIVCFFVAKPHRNSGVSTTLLASVLDHCKNAGAAAVEGYPIAPKKGRIPELFAFTGLASAFKKAGFREIARRSETRPIMRFDFQLRKSVSKSRKKA